MKAGPERELAERYFARLAKAGPSVGLEFSGVRESPESRARIAPERKREEAGKLAEILGSGTLILFDERGKNLPSREIAHQLGSFRDSGTGYIVLAIGGPDGHDAELSRKASLILSFGAQTWPHQLVRVMVAEQLYRAVTILSGHPYHRD